MKTLILCRHAKSSWKHPVQDIHRPLNGRGLRQAPLVARQALKQPDAIFSSPASRAYATALFYFEMQQWDIRKLQLEPALYEAGVDELLFFVNQLHDQLGSVMLFGHNPGFNQLQDFLLAEVQGNLVTSARVELALDIDSWRSACGGCASLVGCLEPTLYE